MSALTIDNTPTVLAATDLLATDHNGLLRTHYSEGEDVLRQIRITSN